MSKRNRKEKEQKQSRVIRVLAIALAVLLIGMVVAEVLPVFGLAEEAPARSHYSLNMAIDLDNQAIAIDQRLDYVNATGRAQDSVWLNVYANTLRRSGAMPVEQNDWNNAFPGGYAPGGVDFISVRVNGQAADWGMSGASEQFMRVACPLKPGQRALIELSFRLMLTENNWTLGVGDLGWRLVNFYPVAAVYDRTAGDFLLNSWTLATDPLMSEPADYQAALTLPEGWAVAATGGATASAPDENGRVTWTVRAENARDFSLAFSRKMNRRQGETAGGLTVRAWASTGAAARAMLDAALPALETYEAWFGPLTLPELDLMETDYLWEGLSKPGLIQVSPALCALNRRNDLAKAVARLCANQWFRGEVGCDPEKEPWLADTLPAYAALLYFEEKEGYGGYLKRLNAQVLEALQITIPGGLTVDSAASRFTSRGEYELVVIDRGCAVLHEARDLMGREAFIASLGRYIAENRGKNATIEAFVSALNETTGQRWDEYIVSQLQNISDYVNQRLEWFE